MTLDSLSDFIAAIEGAGELVRVRQPVAAKLEMCEIADRAMKMPGGGPALLFEQSVLDEGNVGPRTRWRSTCSARCGAWRSP